MVHAMTTGVLLALIVSASALEEFTIYTEPITRVPGEVHNAPTVPIPLPADIVQKYKGKTMGVIRFNLDIVRRHANGSETSVPLYEWYDHHTIQMMGESQVIESAYNGLKQGRDPLGPHADAEAAWHCGKVDVAAAVRRGGYEGIIPDYWMGPVGGAEYRDAERDLPSGYMQKVHNPELLLVVAHFINNQAKDTRRPAYECPCAKDRVFNYQNRTIDGTRPLNFACDAQLLAAHNDACKLEWYTGGYRCCENNASVVEPDERGGPPDTVYGKFTFKVDDVGFFTKSAVFDMLDVSGGNVEYDIPPCSPGQSCVHEVTTVQYVMHAVPQVFKPFPGATVEFLTARGHQHVGGLGLELYNEQTGALICASKPRVGTGTEAGNEAGFIVGIPPCVFGNGEGMTPPPKLKATDKIRIVSRYNSTGPGHLGVMGLWFCQVHVSAYLGHEVTSEGSADIVV